jgi:hypothetical protein
MLLEEMVRAKMSWVEKRDVSNFESLTAVLCDFFDAGRVGRLFMALVASPVREEALEPTAMLFDEILERAARGGEGDAGAALWQNIALTALRSRNGVVRRMIDAEMRLLRREGVAQPRVEIGIAEEVFVGRKTDVREEGVMRCNDFYTYPDGVVSCWARVGGRCLRFEGFKPGRARKIVVTVYDCAEEPIYILLKVTMRLAQRMPSASDCRFAVLLTGAAFEGSRVTAGGTLALEIQDVGVLKLLSAAGAAPVPMLAIAGDRVVSSWVASRITDDFLSLAALRHCPWASALMLRILALTKILALTFFVSDWAENRANGGIRVCADGCAVYCCDLSAGFGLDAKGRFAIAPGLIMGWAESCESRDRLLELSALTGPEWRALLKAHLSSAKVALKIDPQALPKGCNWLEQAVWDAIPLLVSMAAAPPDELPLRRWDYAGGVGVLLEGTSAGSEVEQCSRRPAVPTGVDSVEFKELEGARVERVKQRLLALLSAGSMPEFRLPPRCDQRIEVDALGEALEKVFRGVSAPLIKEAPGEGWVMTSAAREEMTRRASVVAEVQGSIIKLRVQSLIKSFPALFERRLRELRKGVVAA